MRFVSIASSLIVSVLLSLQAQTPPQFEVASIKPSPKPPVPRTPMKVDPAIVVYNSFSLKLLMQVAYKVPEWAITGGPNWLDSDQYDVMATLPAGTSSDQVPAMLQTLLADRFHLEIQHEKKTMPVYELVIGKNGPKLKPGETGEQWSGGFMKGGILKDRLELHQLSMGGLAAVLATKTGRPVIDTTNLSGMFDVTLKWTPDDTKASDAKGPSIYTALEEQLGLKLKPAKAPVDILLITRAEKPSDN